jgi:hypothetical protein
MALKPSRLLYLAYFELIRNKMRGVENTDAKAEGGGSVEWLIPPAAAMNCREASAQREALRRVSSQVLNCVDCHGLVEPEQ